MIKLYFILCVVVFAIGGASSAYAMPMPENIPLEQTAGLAKDFNRLRPSGDLSAGDFHGIVKLSNCSGALVRFTTSVDTDRAMVLTNGHCNENGFPKPGQAIANVPSSRQFLLLSDDGSRSVRLQADLTMLSTMTKTDITLYRLKVTYGEIKQKLGADQALTISQVHTTAATGIAVISGYFKKVYSCQIEKFIYSLHEADWTWFDSELYSTPGCETIHGTSGSPVINRATREIVGINNTGNDDGEKCTMDNPCEVDQQGNVTVNLHRSYAQQTFWLYSCLNEQRQIDLNIPSCILRP